MGDDSPRYRRCSVLPLLLLLSACSILQPPAEAQDPAARIDHVVVIYLENRSFDHLYGEFPGAEGLAAAVDVPKQVDSAGVVYPVLPQPTGAPFPLAEALANAPFAINQFLHPGQLTRDLVHRFYQQQAQINGGRMDKFVAVSDARALAMGYYHTSSLPLVALARQYTLADHFFHAAFGGSFLNHVFLIAAAPPIFADAPTSMVAQLGPDGSLLKDGALTPDGFVVNKAFTVNTPHPATTPPEQLVPNQTLPTIGDRLSEKGLSWAWYAGGWDDALLGHPDPSFQFHHHPFAYFSRYADGTQAKTEHLLDERAFFTAARSGALPAVSFVKPLGRHNEHPQDADVLSSEQHAVELVEAVQQGPNWQHALIIITYDENGGFWDHVPPPKGDRWGPGVRVPTLIISPFARRGFVDHTVYDTTSILAFIEKRFGLQPLSTRDALADPLSGAF